MKNLITRYNSVIAGAIGIGIILPVFFQLKGGLFRETTMVYDSLGMIGRLPLPLSIVVCLIGIPLIGRYRQSLWGFVFVGTTAFLMLITSFFASGGLNQAKLVRTAQFILPMVALILGQMYYYLTPDKRVLSKVFLVVVTAIVVLQLYCSYTRGYTMLVPYIFLPGGIQLFTIYQHLQYVPVTLSAAFIVLVFGLRGHPDLKGFIWGFMPVMVLYMVVSTSLTAILLFAFGLSVYVLLFLNPRRLLSLKFAVIAIAILVMAFGYLHIYRGQHMLEEKLHIAKRAETGRRYVPSMSKRYEYWNFYTGAILADARSFFMGQAGLPSREQVTSAHNYYLDFLYHFGIISFLPFMCLMTATLYGVLRKWQDIIVSPWLSGLTLVVLFLIFAENMLKVGMRQPYPGIFTFFLWGILISELSCLRSST